MNGEELSGEKKILPRKIAQDEKIEKNRNQSKRNNRIDLLSMKRRPVQLFPPMLQRRTNSFIKRCIQFIKKNCNVWIVF